MKAGAQAAGPDRAEIAAALAGVMLAAVLLVPGLPPVVGTALAGAFLGAMLLWIAATDLGRWIIPDGAVIAVGAVGAAWRLAAETAGAVLTPFDVLSIALDGLAWGGALLLVREIHFRRRGFDGLGLGDVKLAAAGGLLVGAQGFTWALLLASLAGLVAAAVLRLGGRAVEKVPFGALLAPALGLVWLFQLLG